MRRLPARAGAVAVATATVVLVLVLPTLTPGCGSGEPQVDKAALYTPDSLAQELAFRYTSLKPEAKKSTRKIASRAKLAKRTAAGERAEAVEKTKEANTATTKKRTGPPTIDDVLEDIDSKINKIEGTGRAETCRQMIAVIAKDSSLTENDKQLLTQKLRELAGTS